MNSSIGPIGARDFTQPPTLLMTAKPQVAYAYSFAAKDGSVTVCFSMGPLQTNFAPEDAVAIGEMLARAGREAIAEREAQADAVLAPASVAVAS